LAGAIQNRKRYDINKQHKAGCLAASGSTDRLMALGLLTGLGFRGGITENIANPEP
jgi:hypothetical protein